MSKKGQKPRDFIAEFKTGAILDRREHHMEFRETARKHRLTIKSEAECSLIRQN